MSDSTNPNRTVTLMNNAQSTVDAPNALTAKRTANSPIDAVVFDMDGVLVDARDWHYEALNQALATVGLHINRAEHLTTYDGLSTKQKLRMLTLEHGLPESLHGFLNDLKQRYTMQIVAASCHPVFEHEYLLSSLKRAGFKVAVASNSIYASVDAIMSRAELLGYFDVVLSNQDVASPKPAPDIYLAAASRLGTTPERCLVVEDNENGIRAATAAGTELLTVSNPDDVNWQRIATRLAQLGALQ